jgi:hypothetical protein
MRVPMQWNLPIVTAATVFPFLESVGIRPWTKLAEPVLLDEYRERELTDQQRSELRFAAKNEVVFLQQPMGGEFRGFRTIIKNWATTFCLLPGDFVPIVAEWKHGAEIISLAPPSGVPSKADNGSMSACAKREFEEETGMTLEKVIYLGPMSGIPINCRSLTTTFCPFFGKVAEPLVVGPSKLDATEHLKLVLFPLNEWMKVVLHGMTGDDCSISTTFLALNYLERISVR